ncbi:MAG: hypothetical protein HY749_17060 [Gammaproteobacteria bacterium]|nr:hypothetical protein [Gammaproteobacteria bacterium]MBI5618709.1 hypothetical protein [Gammaproteobacteria bacterium]
MIEKLKRALAAVILVCFFLPLAQCSSQLSREPRKDEAPNVWIPTHGIDFQSTDEIPIVVMYLWPLAFIGIRHMAQRRIAAIAVNVVEGLLAAGSLYCVVETIRLWGSVRYGGILASGAFAGYIACAVAGLYQRARGNSS